MEADVTTPGRDQDAEQCGNIRTGPGGVFPFFFFFFWRGVTVDGKLTRIEI